MVFKEQMITKDGILYKKKVVELPADPSNDKKAFQRLQIEQQVFDIHDSLADTAKWVSLLSSVVARMYAAMPESQKSTIPAQDRAMIEHCIAKFLASTTRADVQFEQEGIALVDKLFDRQTQLANLIK